MKMKHSNVFYRRTQEGEYTAEKNAKSVRNKAGFDLFRIKNDLFEGSTGLLVKSHSDLFDLRKTVSDLEKQAFDQEAYAKALTASRERFGLSPRYTRPDEKYEDLFPKPEKKDILAAGLDGKKHYFSEVHNQDGIALYIMKNKKPDPWTALYLLYECRMLNVGSLSHKDELVEEYKRGIPDYRQLMTDRLEAALANPNKWADPHFANFLGRLDEAQTHNQSIREEREAERQAKSHREEEERLNEQREYEVAIFDAEQAILNKRELFNYDIRGTALILQLFRENGVELPLKTQGWVKSSLRTIYYHDDYWSYRYVGRPSTVIHGYLDKLAKTIEKKHEQQPEPDTDVEPDDEMEI